MNTWLIHGTNLKNKSSSNTTTGYLKFQRNNSNVSNVDSKPLADIPDGQVDS